MAQPLSKETDRTLQMMRAVIHRLFFHSNRCHPTDDGDGCGWGRLSCRHASPASSSRAAAVQDLIDCKRILREVCRHQLRCSLHVLPTMKDGRQLSDTSPCPQTLGAGLAFHSMLAPLLELRRGPQGRHESNANTLHIFQMYSLH